MTKLIILFLTFSVFSYINANYCALQCGDSIYVDDYEIEPIHIVCLRKSWNCGIDTDKCGSPYEAIDLDEEDMELILDVHNELRNKVATGQEIIGRQPSASDMSAMKYHQELGKIAQCLTNSCEIRRDDCRRTKDFDRVGQNIGLKVSSKPINDYKSIINTTILEWYDEVKNFEAEWVSSCPEVEEGVDRYTQLVWSDSEFVGCGLTFFFRDGWYNYFFVCNYGPGGNVEGESVYKTGRPVTRCYGVEPNSKYPGLCGEVDFIL